MRAALEDLNMIYATNAKQRKTTRIAQYSELDRKSCVSAKVICDNKEFPRTNSKTEPCSSFEEKTRLRPLHGLTTA